MIIIRVRSVEALEITIIYKMIYVFDVIEEIRGKIGYLSRNIHLQFLAYFRRDILHRLY